MPEDTFIRLCLKDSVMADEISVLAWELDWDIFDIIKAGDQTNFEKIWHSQDESTAIHYVEDRMIGVRYLLIRGARHQEIARQVRQSCAIYDREELTGLYDAAGDEKTLAKVLRLMAVTAAPQTPDPDWLARFEQAGAHAQPVVRQAAVLAAVYTGWQGLAPMLTRLSRNEPDPATRTLAQKALAALERNDWQP